MDRPTKADVEEALRLVAVTWSATDELEQVLAAEVLALRVELANERNNSRVRRKRSKLSAFYPVEAVDALFDHVGAWRQAPDTIMLAAWINRLEELADAALASREPKRGP